jgi:hypothetical protein
VLNTGIVVSMSKSPRVTFKYNRVSASDWQIEVTTPEPKFGTWGLREMTRLCRRWRPPQGQEMGDLELHQQWARQLEKLGVENVRICLASNTYIPDIDREYAWEWLSEKDKKQRAGDRRYARWTLVASLIGAAAAIVAAVASVLALR